MKLSRSALRVCAPFFAAAALMACGSTATQADAGDAAVAPADVVLGECTAIAHTCAEVTAAFASNSATVMLTCDEAAGTFTVTSTGVPNYTSNQTTPNAIREQGWIVVFPLRPACAASTTDVVNSRGAVGFMVNGVPFYGPQDAQGRDALQFEGQSFDDCEGHADQSCSYHYHTEPLCVFGVHDTAAQHRLADGHPPVIGYALDGFALYASYTASDPPATLDGCHGHSDATRGYHYHASGTNPYLVGCYRGAATGRMMRTMNLCGGTMPAGDGGVTPGGDAGTGPRACTTTSECTGACPMGSMGCTCAMGMGGALLCLPSCNATADCPTTPMGMLTCDAARHLCVPQ